MRFELRQNGWSIVFFGLIVLFAGCSRSSPPPNPSTPEVAPKTASIAASPNPVPLGAAKPGSTTITWSTGDGSIGEVYVIDPSGTEKKFAGNRSQGTLEAPWIGNGVYEFRLYAGKEKTKVLASVKVARAAQ